MHRLQVNSLSGQKMEQQILNNIVGKYELQKKGLFAIAPVKSTSLFLIVSIIFFSQCVLVKYSTSISESWLMAIAFPTVHLFFSSLAVPFFAYPLILYSSLSPFLLTLCLVPASYFCQVFGVAIFSDELNCFDITNKKTLTKIKM